MDKKVTKILYTLIMKDIDISTLSCTDDDTKKLFSELKTKIVDDFKMVSDALTPTTTD